MIERNLTTVLLSAATRFPVVTVTGPRQSGKTTLCQAVFPGRNYVSLERPDVRDRALSDPLGFLDRLRDGAILDEVQRAPNLLSYLQEEVDRRREPGRFILTGSSNLMLLAVSQSLAGRTALLTLLPPGHDELRRFQGPALDLFATLWTGAYPAIHDRRVPADEWLNAYVETYVERDVRQILNVGDLATFQTFLRLCAGRTAQLLNLSALAADCGINHGTARAWLSVLEASYLVARIPPLLPNLNKRLVRTPKLHFLDCGLACALLGITTPDQIRTHPLRGSLFESWVVSEVMKARLHRGLPSGLSFYRDRGGLEADLVVESGTRCYVVEAKSGQTPARDFLGPLERVAGIVARDPARPDIRQRLAFGGDDAGMWGRAELVPWNHVAEAGWD
jgi:predicted AAA+ superfamily ATPase